MLVTGRFVSCFSMLVGRLTGAFPGVEQQQKREDRNEAMHGIE